MNTKLYTVRIRYEDGTISSGRNILATSAAEARKIAEARHADAMQIAIAERTLTQAEIGQALKAAYR